MTNHSKDVFMVYGASWCPFCAKANLLLEELGHKSYFFDAAEDEEYLSEIKNFFQSSTVPVISRISSTTGVCKVIGGYSDLREYFDEE